MQAPPPISPDGFGTVGYTSRRITHPLFQEARRHPAKIDNLLKPYLHSDTFPDELEHYIHDYVSTCGTPALFGDWSPDRPRWYYANCLIHGMLLGRAFSLLSTPTRPPRSLSSISDFPFPQLPAELRLQIYEYYKEDLAQRQRYWDVMTRIFIKALWSGRDPEEGARYTSGIIMLASGNALSSAAPLLRGHGDRWVWWHDEIKTPEHTWGWEELHSAVMATADLPRSNTNIKQLRKRWEIVRVKCHDLNDPSQRENYNLWQQGSEYVSSHVLQALDLAREHLRSDERDWTAPELTAKFMHPLFDSDGEAQRLWEATGRVPPALERRPGDEPDSDED